MAWELITAQDRERLGHPLSRFYLLSVIGGLLILALVLTERDLGCSAFALVLLGAAGLVTKSRLVPIVFLGLLTAILMARADGIDLMSVCFQFFFDGVRHRGFRGRLAGADQSILGPNQLFDALLALAVLVYFQGHYRLYGLLGSALPGEGREKRSARDPLPRDPGPDQALAGADQSTKEGFQGLATLILVVVLATFTWVVVYHTEPLTDVTRETWWILLLVWLLASALIVTTTVARIIFWRTAPPEVHRLYLQETLWRETRSDQARINRWLMAARLKAQKRKERS
jgi:hypothetical protein